MPTTGRASNPIPPISRELRSPANNHPRALELIGNDVLRETTAARLASIHLSGSEPHEPRPDPISRPTSPLIAHPALHNPPICPTPYAGPRSHRIRAPRLFTIRIPRLEFLDAAAYTHHERVDGHAGRHLGSRPHQVRVPCCSTPPPPPPLFVFAPTLGRPPGHLSTHGPTGILFVAGC
jgi:hypothetical protein